MDTEKDMLNVSANGRINKNAVPLITFANIHAILSR